MLKGVIVAFGAPRARSAYPVAFVANGTKSFATRTTPEKLSSFSSVRYAPIEAVALGVVDGWSCDVTQLARTSAAIRGRKRVTETPSGAQGVPRRSRGRS